MREVYTRKVAPPRGLGFLAGSSGGEAVRWLRQPRVALVAADTVLHEAAQLLSAGEACQYNELTVDTPLIGSIGTRKGSPFTELFHSGCADSPAKHDRSIRYRFRIVLVDIF